MSYLGDYPTSGIVYFTFTTIANTTGAPTTLSGTPAISVYKDDGNTESTAGVTLSADFDSRTGLNNVKVDTSADGTFYAAGHDFSVVITTGTVGGTSVVGYTVGTFSINNRTALRPTTAGRTLDVTATGEAGLDWANIGSPTTSQTLSGTTIATTQKVDIETIKTNPVVNAGTVTFPTTATLASTTNITSATGVDITKILGTAISTPATAGILDVNVKNMNNVAATSITAVNANQGTTQPVNFTGTGASALVKSDTVDIAGAAVSTSTAQVGVNVVSYASGQSPLQPTVSGRTLDVTTTGEAGIDWSNIGASTTTVNLSGTTIKDATDVETKLGTPAGASVSVDIAGVQSDTNDIQTRLPAALVGGRMDSSVGAIAAGLIQVKKNTALAAFEFVMFDSTTGNPSAGLIVTAQRSIDGGAYAACANAVAEVSGGTYKIDLAATDLNGDTITLMFTAATAKTTFIEIIPQP